MGPRCMALAQGLRGTDGTNSNSQVLIQSTAGQVMALIHLHTKQQSAGFRHTTTNITTAGTLELVETKQFALESVGNTDSMHKFAP